MSKGATLAKTVLAPLVVMIVGALTIWGIERYVQSREQPKITVESKDGAISVTNKTSDVLRVRVAYTVVEDGSETFCYPMPTKSDGGEDPKVLPGQTLSVPPGTCGVDFDSYAVWAWNPQGGLVFHYES